MKSIVLMLILSILALGNPSQAFENNQDLPMKFEFKTYDSLSKSTVHIEIVENVNGVLQYRGHGSGVIISKDLMKRHETDCRLVKGNILTCDHVSILSKKPNHYLRIKFQNGKSSQARILKSNTGMDISLLECYVPEDYLTIQPSTKKPKYGDVIRGCGYGAIRNVQKPRYFETKIWRAHNYRIIMNEDVIPGDSGGPIYDSEGKLVGLISAGILPLSYAEGNPIGYTSPGFGPSVGLIQHFLAQYTQDMRVKGCIPEEVK